MEKETLISNLKTKVGENDFNVLSERTVDNLVEQFMPMFADDEKVTDETYNLPVSLLKSYIGQYRHDVKDGIGKGVAEGKTAWEAEQKTAQEKAIADAITKAKEEWEKETGGKGGKGGKGDEDDKGLDEKIQNAITNALSGLTGNDGAIGKLTKQLGDYITAQAEKEKAAAIAKTKGELKDFLIELGADESKPRVIELALADVEIGENAVLSDLQKIAKAKYESLFKDLYGDSTKPFAGGGAGSGGGDSDAALKAYLKEVERKTAEEAKAAEALKSFLK